MRLRGATTVAMLAVLLTACSAPTASGPSEAPNPYLTVALGADGPGTAPGPGIYPLVPATHAHVQFTCPLVPAVHYDPAAIPRDEVDGAYVCTTRPYTPAYDGTAQIEEFVDRVATEDVPVLLTAYATADVERTDDLCGLVLHDPLIVWLHHSDEITPVYAPQTACGAPDSEAAAVYVGLTLHRILVAREKLTA
jgi:hypothetical protein